MSAYTDLQHEAMRLVGHASLREARLFGVTAKHLDFPSGQGEVTLGDISAQLQAPAIGQGAAAYVLVINAVVYEDSGGADPARKLAEIEVGYGAMFVLDDQVEDVSPRETKAFGFTVAVMTIWPYARAMIASVAREMNLTPAPIPTITQAELAELAAASAEVSSDSV